MNNNDSITRNSSNKIQSVAKIYTHTHTTRQRAHSLFQCLMAVCAPAHIIFSMSLQKEKKT